MKIIINLEDYQIDGIFQTGISTKDGVVQNVSLNGKVFTIIDFIDYQYSIKLKRLTESEVKEIQKGLLKLSLLGTGIELYPEEVIKYGYINFSPNNKTNLIFELSKINIKPSDILGTYDFTIPCYDRVFGGGNVER